MADLWESGQSTDDEEVTEALLRLRLEVRGAVAEACPALPDALVRNGIGPEEHTAAIEQLAAAALSVDASSTAALASAIAEAEQPGRAGSSQVLLAHARALTQVRRHESALALSQEILRRRADAASTVAALYWSAVALGQLARRDEAVAALHHAAALSVDDVEDQILIGEQFLALDAPAAAGVAASRATDLAAASKPSVDVVGQISTLWLLLHEPLLAGDTSWSEPDAAVRVHQLAAKLLLEELEPAAPRRAVSVLTRLEQRLGSFADRPSARMWLGSALAANGQFVDALEYLDAGLDASLADVASRERRGMTLYWRGVALLETGEPAAAEQTLRQAIELLGEPHLTRLAAQAELVLAIALVTQGRRADARTLFDGMTAGGESAEEPGDTETVDRYGELAETLDEQVLHHALRATALTAADRARDAIDELGLLEARAADATSAGGRILRAQSAANKAILLVREDDIDGARRALARR